MRVKIALICHCIKMISSVCILLLWLSIRRASCQEQCGKYLFDAYGTITPPDSDNDGYYDNNRDCYWTIEVWKNNAIQLDFVLMDMQPDPKCSYDFVFIVASRRSENGFYEDNVLKVCGQVLPPPVLLPRILLIAIHFHSDEEISGTGFNISYRQIEEWKCGSTEFMLVGSLSSLDSNGDGFYEQNLLCVWMISIMKQDIINLYTTKFDIPQSSNCTQAALQVYNPTIFYGAFCGANRPPLISTRLTHLNIRFHSDCCSVGEGFKATYTQQKGMCGSILTEPKGFIESPDYDGDGHYEHNLNCWWVMVAPEKGFVLLLFLSLAIEYDANCNFDFVMAYDGDISASSNLGWACGNKLPGVIMSHTNVLYLQFYTDGDDKTIDGGFTAVYRFGSLCGAILPLYDLGFKSQDADGDGYYDHNLDCTWFILPKLYEVIKLYVAQFDIPSTNNCTQDYLEIYGDKQKFGVYCGRNRPPKIASSDRVLTSHFHSDCCVTGKGFFAIYLVVVSEITSHTDSLLTQDEHILCGDILLKSTGTVQSVDMDNDGQYDGNCRCRWIIAAPERSGIELSFKTMALEYHENCDFDSVKVYDSAMPIGSFCGDEIPPVIRSVTSVLTIDFWSDADVFDTGFIAEYSFINHTSESSYVTRQSISSQNESIISLHTRSLDKFPMSAAITNDLRAYTTETSVTDNKNRVKTDDVISGSRILPTGSTGLAGRDLTTSSKLYSSSGTESTTHNLAGSVTLGSTWLVFSMFLAN